MDSERVLDPFMEFGTSSRYLIGGILITRSSVPNLEDSSESSRSATRSVKLLLPFDLARRVLRWIGGRRGLSKSQLARNQYT